MEAVFYSLEGCGPCVTLWPAFEFACKSKEIEHSKVKITREGYKTGENPETFANFFPHVVVKSGGESALMSVNGFIYAINKGAKSIFDLEADHANKLHKKW